MSKPPSGKTGGAPPDISSHSAGRLTLWKFATWPLTARVVLATMFLSIIAIVVVGNYLTSSFASSLHEQRRERSLEQSQQIRDGLVENLNAYRNESSAVQRAVLDEYVAAVSHGDPAVFKGFAVTRIDGTVEAETFTNNDALREWSTGMPEGTDSTTVGDFTFATVAYVVDSRSEPAYLVRTTASAAGRTYQLLFLYSRQQEEDTVDNVNAIVTTAAVIMLALIFAISLSVSRLVRQQLRSAAEGAERISRGELSYRVPITGSDELSRLGTSFNHMAATLEQKIDDLVELSLLQKRFVSDVSHELRTPLTTIKLASSVLDSHKEELPTVPRRASELLAEKVNGFQDLLFDLLEMSRHDAGGARLQAREGDLAELVDAVLDSLAPIVEKDDARVLVRHHSSDMRGVFDPRRVARITRNLLTNALEHRMDRPVLVETASNDCALSVVVQDFGVGLDHTDASHVFDRFWRANPARNRTLGGTGLGLAISREDALLHGGDIEVSGALGKGAVFRLTLPRIPGQPVGRPPLKLERHRDSSGASVPGDAA